MPYGSDPTIPQAPTATFAAAPAAAAPQDSGLPPEADTLYGRVRAAEGTAHGTGYVTYGGKPFTPGKEHPGEAARVPGPQGPTSAAGPGQWEEATWNGLKPEFRSRFGHDPAFDSDEDQKRMTWINAAKVYPGGEEALRRDLAAGKLNTAALASQWSGFGARTSGGYGKDPVISAGKWNVSPNAIAAAQSIPDSELLWNNPADYRAAIEPTDSSAKRKSLLKNLMAGSGIEDVPEIELSKPDKNGVSKIVGFDGANRAKIAAEELGDNGLMPVLYKFAGKERPSWIEDMHGNRHRFNFPLVAGSKPAVRPSTIAERLGTGLLDPVYGAEQMIAHLMPSGVAGAANAVEGVLNRAANAIGLPPGVRQDHPLSAAELDQKIRERERQIEQERAASGATGPDLARLGGNIVAMLPMAAAGPAVAGGGAMGAIAGGAAAGAGGALTAPVTQGDYATNKAEQIALGTILGGGLGLGGNAMARVIAPKILPAAQRLLDKGVRLLPGQLKGGAMKAAEEKMTSVPFSGEAVAAAQRRVVEDWNRAMYNDVLNFAGERYSGQEVGTKGIAAVERKLSERYDQLKPGIRFRADAQYNRNVANLKMLVSQLPADLAKAFDNTVRTVDTMMGPQRTMDGQTFKEVESTLSSAARDWHHPTNTVLERKVGDAILSLLGELREDIERHSAPGIAKELRDLNTAWAAFVRLREASTRRPTSGGIFTPGDLLAAEKKVGGRNVFARGDGLLQRDAQDAQEVIGNRYPDSGTAGRYGQLGETAELMALAVHNPAAAVGQIMAHAAHAAAYTSPGVRLLRGLAGVGFPQTRNVLARIPRVTGNALAPGAALSATGGPQ